MNGQTSKEKTGYISKIIPSKRNPNWLGFVFQDSDEMYSITLTEKVSPDLSEIIKNIQPKNRVTFYYTSNKGTDGKVYNNIAGVELLQDVRDDQEDEEPDNGGRVSDRPLRPQDLCIMAQVAMKEAGADRQASLIGHNPISVEETVEAMKQYTRGMAEIIGELLRE